MSNETNKPSIAEQFLPFLVPAVKQIADAQVKGEELNEAGQIIVSVVHGVLEHIEPYTDMSQSAYDDMALETVKSLCEDTAKEGDFPILMLQKPE